MPKQTKSYATRIPPSIWEQHRHRIETLFLYKDKTLSDVMEMMKDQGFYASESQYERQLKVWGIRKNWKKRDCSQTTHFFERIDKVKEEIALYIDAVELLKEIVTHQFRREWPSYWSFEYEYVKSNTLEDFQTLAGFLAKRSERFNFYVRHVEDMVKEHNLPIVPRRWRQFLSGCTRRIEAKLQQLQPILRYFIEMSSALDFLEKLHSEILSRNIDIESYLSGGEFEESYIPDPDSRHHTQRDRQGLSSPMKSWDARMWESVGVTAEEWMYREWDMFFGSWG